MPKTTGGSASDANNVKAVARPAPPVQQGIGAKVASALAAKYVAPPPAPVRPPKVKPLPLGANPASPAVPAGRPVATLPHAKMNPLQQARQTRRLDAMGVTKNPSYDQKYGDLQGPPAKPSVYSGGNAGRPVPSQGFKQGMLGIAPHSPDPAAQGFYGRNGMPAAMRHYNYQANYAFGPGAPADPLGHQAGARFAQSLHQPVTAGHTTATAHGTPLPAPGKLTHAQAVAVANHELQHASQQVAAHGHSPAAVAHAADHFHNVVQHLAAHTDPATVPTGAGSSHPATGGGSGGGAPATAGHPAAGQPASHPGSAAVDPITKSINDMIAAQVQQNNHLESAYRTEVAGLQTATTQNGQQLLAAVQPVQPQAYQPNTAYSPYAQQQMQGNAALSNNVAGAQGNALQQYLAKNANVTQAQFGNMAAASGQRQTEYANYLASQKPALIQQRQMMMLDWQMKQAQMQLAQNRYGLAVQSQQDLSSWRNNNSSVQHADRQAQMQNARDIASGRLGLGYDRLNASLGKGGALNAGRVAKDRRSQLTTLRTYQRAGSSQKINNDGTTSTRPNIKEATDILGRAPGALDFDNLVNAIVVDTGVDPDVAVAWAQNNYGDLYGQAVQRGYRVQLHRDGSAYLAHAGAVKRR